MVQQESVFSKQYITQQLTQTLGQALSESEVSNCLKQIQYLEPSTGKQFWQASDATVGIYIILAGKVRLIGSDDSLIASLEAPESFAELTLFPQGEFQPYAARASVGLKLCYLPQECLQNLIRQYPNIGDRLYQQALLWDLLLLCRQTTSFRDSPVEELMKVVSLLEQHDLQVGELPASLLKQQRFWLLRSGELLHPDNRKLTAGSIYTPSQSREERAWQVTQPTELYSLGDSHWQTALQLEEREMGRAGDGESGRWGDGGRRKISRSPIQNPKSKTRPQDAVRGRQNPKSPEPAVKGKTQNKISKAYFPSPSVKVGHFWQRVSRRYPFFRQQSMSDCGAACLVMVGRYWGKRFSINRLRDITNADRNGASLRGVAAAAEHIGFSSRPVKATLDKLAKQNLPAIVHWEGKHYIVVYEITRKRVIVGDPAIGPRTLSHAEFKAGWTGYTLLLQPTALLKDADESSEPFWRFFELVKPHRLVLLEVLMASILIQIFGLVTPLLTQLLLDRVVVQRSTLSLTAVGLGLLIFSLFRVAMTGLRQYLLDHTANRIDLALIAGFIKHTFRLPLRFFEFRFVGDIISRVQENRKIQRFLTGEALSISLDLLTVFVYVGLMFWYSWKMALLVLVIVPPFVLLALIATPFLQRVSRDIFSAYAVESSYLIESLTGIRTIKSMAIERTVRWQWEGLFQKSI